MLIIVEGMGYYDDGEEHLGVNDDEYDRKYSISVLCILFGSLTNKL